MISFAQPGGEMALWVENETRRANRNLLLCNGLIAAVMVLILAANYRYCANFLLGCQPVANAELAGITSPDQRWRNFVTVTGTKAVNSGYQDIVKHMQNGRVVSTEVKDEYVFLRVGDKLLLVKAPPGGEKLEYSGELVTTTSQVADDLVRPLTVQQPEAAVMVLPFTLNAADYRNNGYAMLFLVVPLLALAAWNCLKAVRRSAEPQLAPVWKNLAAFGNAEQLSQQIEAELQPNMIRRYGKLQITQQWMVRRKLFSTWVSPVGDLVWIYKKVTKHSVNFIPTGKTYSVVLVGRHRQRTEEQMKEKAVNELLVDLANRVPWALFGFDQNLDKAWRKDPAGVIRSVDARYQQQQSKAAAASPASS
jgi:Family of unknown function (DUF6709)